MLSDLEIARAADLLPIDQVAQEMGLQSEEIEQYGAKKAKVSLGAIERLQNQPTGKYIVVTAITPTPLGEGKTVTTVGLAQALQSIGKRAVPVIRQPSLGPVFGIKGGAAGGGYAQVVPMEDLNLHFTGDFHAVTSAHNLLAAMTDAHMMHGNKLGIDPAAVTWTRVLDVLDRSLRQTVIGLGGKGTGLTREATFEITAASEVMAILALSDSLTDLKARLARIIVGHTSSGGAIHAGDLNASGAMAVLLKDAIKPNLIQTLEGGPALVHAGPFGNIAHGCSSILADRLALKTSEYVVTEAGFGADLGFEKFCDIKCRASGLAPDAAVLVCTIRSLKAHSGRFKIIPGKPLDEKMLREDLDSLQEGSRNLARQIANVREFGIPVVVAINRFETDTDAEIDLVTRIARNEGAADVAVSEVFSHGGRGGESLAQAVVRAAEIGSTFKLLYPLEADIETKIETIATRIYGAESVTFDAAARRKIRQLRRTGFNDLPICMAKTQYSLSHSPALKGSPSGYDLPIVDIRLSAGAGFLYPLCGEIMTMPGLPSIPGATRIDLTDEGEVVGLS